MSRPYAVLLAVVLAVGLGLGALSRRPREAPALAVVEAPRDTVALELEVRDGAVVPASSSVPKGGLVRLEVRNAGAAPVQFSLAGYEDRVSAALEGDRTWQVVFVADRPGEDFAWLVDGHPAGRFVVAGSHLVEGHR